MKIRCLGCMEEYDETFDVCPFCGILKNSPPRERFHLIPGVKLKGKYEVGYVLGSGNSDFCITYLGYDLENLKKVIVKEYFPKNEVIRTKGTSYVELIDETYGEVYQKGCNAFCSEGQKISKIRCMGIANVLDCFTENATAYQVIEFVKGMTLKEWLSSGETMSMNEALGYMMPVIEALKRLHRQGLYHLAVKPGNIYFTAEGETKLTNFSQYKYASLSDRTQLPRIVPRVYSAPEVYEQKDVRDTADVYSVCAVLYQMVTGEEPQDAIERMQKDEMISPKEKKTSISQTKDNILMNGLNISIDKRIQSMEELEELFTGLTYVERIEDIKPQKSERKESYSTDIVTGKKKRFPIMGTIGVGVVALVIVVGAMITINKKNVKPVTEKQVAENKIMDVQNEKIEAAQQAAQAQGLEINIKDYQYNDKKENGIILFQESDPENGKIDVIVNTTKKTTMKDQFGELNKNPENSENIEIDNISEDQSYVSGYKVDDFYNYLKESGFKVYTVEESEEKYNGLIPGYLTRVSYTVYDEKENYKAKDKNASVDTDLPDGCSLTVYKAKDVTEDSAEENVGEKTGIKIKGLINLSFEEILKKAKEKHFYVGLDTKKEYSHKMDTDEEKGSEKGNICKIINQKTEKSLSSNYEIKTGDQIILIISKGPKTLTKNEKEAIKKLVGKGKNEVQEKLKNDYYLDLSFTRAFDIKPEGTVIDIESKDGLKWDDTVSVTVSRGPRPTTQQPAETKPSGGGGTGGQSHRGGSSNGGGSHKDDGPNAGVPVN